MADTEGHKHRETNFHEGEGLGHLSGRQCAGMCGRRRSAGLLSRHVAAGGNHEVVGKLSLRLNYKTVKTGENIASLWKQYEMGPMIV
ncbi:hypothetical protein MSG28_006673 [Choristoneura fumiferana]|uniref:Uncharacterized protein n=1 Tax=Choristoneura fumiferana TaxID=7141 RepID=A0ACC0JKX8_CHOFU|nr:hypothetical protein MSG28_006673 [Choristoneura fumiferana]